MTFEQAQKITTKYTILSTTSLMLFFTLLLLIGETRGDFANGILFFLAGLINPVTIIFLIILYALTYFLSRRAAKDIILKGKSTWQVALVISILISLVTVLYFNIWAVIKMNDSNTVFQISNLLSPALRLFFMTAFFEFILWAWVAAKTKKLKIDDFELDGYR